MKTLFMHNFQVIGVDDILNLNFIEKEIEKDFSNIFNENFEKKIKGWNIELNLIYNNAENILLFKKGKKDIDNQYITYTIHLPIPKKDNVSWGMDRSSFIGDVVDNKLNMKNFYVLNRPPYSSFTDMNSYLVHCVYLVLKKIFEEEKETLSKLII
jgi:hypothetical protein